MFNFPWYYYAIFIGAVIIIVPLIFISCIIDFLANDETVKAIIREKISYKTIVSENGVTVSYRLDPKTSLFAEEEKNQLKLKETEEQIRAILRNNPGAILFKHEPALGIQIYHVDPQQQPAIAPQIPKLEPPSIKPPSYDLYLGDDDE